MPPEWANSEGAAEIQPTSYNLGLSDPYYYRKLQKYNIFTEAFEPPDTFMRAVQKDVLEPSKLTLDNALAKRIGIMSRQLRTATEQPVITKLAGKLFRMFDELPEKIYLSQDMIWTDAFPLEASTAREEPPSITLPKPDAAFSINAETFLSPRRAGAAESLCRDGSYYGMPDKRGGWFPFLSVEFKAVATKGTRYVGTDQANLTGRCATSTSRSPPLSDWRGSLPRS